MSAPTNFILTETLQTFTPLSVPADEVPLKGVPSALEAINDPFNRMKWLSIEEPQATRPTSPKFQGPASSNVSSPSPTASQNTNNPGIISPEVGASKKANAKDPDMPASGKEPKKKLWIQLPLLFQTVKTDRGPILVEIRKPQQLMTSLGKKRDRDHESESNLSQAKPLRLRQNERWEYFSKAEVPPYKPAPPAGTVLTFSTLGHSSRCPSSSLQNN